MAQIHEKMLELMRLASGIEKDRKNQQQNYNFRGIDDVYNALHPHMVAAGVFTTSEIVNEHHEERQSKSGGTLIYRVLKIRYHFHAADGSSVTSEVIGEGMDSGDKAANKAMAVGHKYALLQALAIPTTEPKDPEHESHEVAPRAPGGIDKATFARLVKAGAAVNVTADQICARVGKARGGEMTEADALEVEAWLNEIKEEEHGNG